MNLTPRGKSALCGHSMPAALPPLTLSPRNLLFQLKRKALSILFQPVKTFGEQRARKPNTGIVGPHGVP